LVKHREACRLQQASLCFLFAVFIDIRYDFIELSKEFAKIQTHTIDNILVSEYNIAVTPAFFNVKYTEHDIAYLHYGFGQEIYVLFSMINLLWILRAA